MNYVATTVLIVSIALYPSVVSGEERPEDQDTSQQVQELHLRIEAFRIALDNAKAYIEKLEKKLQEANEKIDLLEMEQSYKVDYQELRAKKERLRQERISLEQERLNREKQEARERERVFQEQQRRTELEIAERPKWHYTWEVGYINSGTKEITYVEAGSQGAIAVIERIPLVDRENVLVRGTFENQSRETYRYTFEIRFSGRDTQGFIKFKRPPRIVGSARYQTPYLDSGQIHRWEIPVRVGNIYDIAGSDIGNVRADPLSDNVP